VSRLKREPIYHTDHIEILLTRGYSALVDLDCFSWILQRSWVARVCPHTVYARCMVQGKDMALHRAVLGSACEGQYVDHINSDGLDCRSANLRACSQRQNGANRGANSRAMSRYRGVVWHAKDRKWQTQIARRVAGKYQCQYIGQFADELQAARAWDKAAIDSGWYDLAFLRLNFPVTAG
jgi:hypothetical protein